MGSFGPDAELPDHAVATGYENYHGVEVWLADDLSTAFAVDGDTVEAWPAFPGSLSAREVTPATRPRLKCQALRSLLRRYGLGSGRRVVLLRGSRCRT